MSGDGWLEHPRRARESNVRAADGDREATVARLRREHLEGRLDDEELQERIERALSAKTYAELDSLVSDLPAEQPRPTRKRTRSRRAWTPMALLLVIAVLVAASGGRLLWVSVPAFFLIVRPMIGCTRLGPYRGRSGTAVL
jgi:hypothetical protein